jgi:hypothetical protein
MAEPPITEDGHHVVINGRKWRATDPSVGEHRGEHPSTGTGERTENA